MSVSSRRGPLLRTGFSTLLKSDQTLFFEKVTKHLSVAQVPTLTLAASRIVSLVLLPLGAEPEFETPALIAPTISKDEPEHAGSMVPSEPLPPGARVHVASLDKDGTVVSVSTEYGGGKCYGVRLDGTRREAGRTDYSTAVSLSDVTRIAPEVIPPPSLVIPPPSLVIPPPSLVNTPPSLVNNPPSLVNDMPSLVIPLFAGGQVRGVAPDGVARRRQQGGLLVPHHGLGGLGHVSRLVQVPQRGHRQLERLRQPGE